MEDTSFLAPLLLTIGGLVIGALLKSLLRHTRIPYTVGLFCRRTVSRFIKSLWNF